MIGGISMQHLTSGELAKLLNITKYVVRHYEEQQIIQPAFIDVNGYHMYGEAEVYAMSHILLLKQLGFSLKEIKNIVEKKTDYTEALSSVLVHFENEITRLTKLKGNVQTILEFQQTETYKLVEENKEDRYFACFEDEFVDEAYNLNLKKLAKWKNGNRNIVDDVSYAILENGSNVKVMYRSSLEEADYAFRAGTYYCKKICVELEDQLLEEIECFYKNLDLINAKFEHDLLILEEANLSAFYIKEMVYSLEVKAK